MQERTKTREPPIAQTDPQSSARSLNRGLRASLSLFGRRHRARPWVPPLSRGPSPGLLRPHSLLLERKRSSAGRSRSFLEGAFLELYEGDIDVGGAVGRADDVARTVPMMNGAPKTGPSVPAVATPHFGPRTAGARVALGAVFKSARSLAGLIEGGVKIVNGSLDGKAEETGEAPDDPPGFCECFATLTGSPGEKSEFLGFS
ncbi:hypothetical protein IscW_ISCW014196 [Ixodes scapularis]|uniref:Uncharacterized protein n=1 Tax=Ixodes scapularis TaxID=6945 RepID=B7QKU0_IXOSC|nr:hypothetical protein IscW_ISCW014196 [Ixodes scapularis]|eukprot:XP_002415795.1 hypothetical protein IscW_ISCW014196 [Ixodes scapularis]